MDLKVGRNDPCPCGSGKKYKKCCLLTNSVRTTQTDNKRDEFSKKIWKQYHEHQMLERLREDRYGKVRPIIHMDFQGYKFVAVGNQLHYSKNWKTFPDFLMSYISSVIGEDWGNSELTKPYEERHPILKWYDGVCRFQRRGKKDGQVVYSGIPDGIAHAYYCLAYDLYVLRHHTALQNEVVRRLKHPDQFQGARYELFVTATCIRAGFDIKYEDESDKTKTHPEFIATHKESGQTISVEAKSRHRPGVLGFPGRTEPDAEIKAGAKRLLNKAFRKSTNRPYAIFIDLNLPPSSGEFTQKPWFKEVWNSVYEDGAPTMKNPDPYNLLVFTNHPDHYGEEGKPYPPGNTIFVITQYPRIPAHHPEVFEALHKAAFQYGKVPNRFPKDWQS